MPTSLGPELPTTWRGNYPHILPSDFPLWTSFLDNHGHEYLSVFYQVRVGGPDPQLAILSEKWARTWYTLKAYRIDAILRAQNMIRICEISTQVGIRAIGQLQVYKQLWDLDPAIKLPYRLTLVCQLIDPDLEYVAQKLDYDILKP